MELKEAYQVVKIAFYVLSMLFMIYKMINR